MIVENSEDFVPNCCEITDIYVTNLRKPNLNISKTQKIKLTHKKGTISELASTHYPISEH